MTSATLHDTEVLPLADLGTRLAIGRQALYEGDVATAQKVIAQVASEFQTVAPDGTYVPRYDHPCIAAFAELTAGIQSMARPVADDL